MNCAEVRELTVETLSGTTPPELRRAVETHLAGCAACRAEALAFEETAHLLRRAPEARLRDEHWAAFMGHLEARLEAEDHGPWTRVVRWFRNPRHAWSTAAATAALVVLLGLARFVPSNLPVAPPVATEATPAHVTGLLSPQVIERMPAMNASLAVWKAGLGAGEVSYELSGGK